MMLRVNSENGSLRAVHKLLCILVAIVLSGCGSPTAPSESPESKPGFSVPAPQGTTSSGGGNALESEFKTLGFSSLTQVQKSSRQDLAEFDLAKFEEVLNQTKVIVSEAPLQKDGKPVDALNFPDLLEIHVYRKAWDAQLDLIEKQRLVVHEVFGLMRKNDRNYQLTNKLLLNLNRSTQVVFESLTFQGPVAADLIKTIDWKTIDSNRTLPIRKNVVGDKTIYSLRISNYPQFSLHCSFLLNGAEGDLNILFASPAWKNHVNVYNESSYCWLNVKDRGYLQGGWATIQIQDETLALWDSLCPKDQKNFDYKLIKGFSSNGAKVISIRHSDL